MTRQGRAVHVDVTRLVDAGGASREGEEGHSLQHRDRTMRRLGIATLGVALAIAVMSPAALAGPSHAWTRHAHSDDYDEGYDVAVDAGRNSYIVGYTEGTFAGQTARGGSDAFIRKLPPDGSTAWTRQFGTSSDDHAEAVTVDKHDRIYVVGVTRGAFPGNSHKGDDDVFVRKYRPNGAALWTRQFGTDQRDVPSDVAVDKAGRVYIVGSTFGAFPRHANRGADDAFVRKYRPDGAAVWTRQFGSASSDSAGGVTVDRNSRIYVAGSTSGRLPRQPDWGGSDAFLRRFEPNGRAVWTRQFGSGRNDHGRGAAVDGSGRVYVVGETAGRLPYQTNKGGSDAFLRGFDPRGRTVWTRQFGSSGNERRLDVAVDRHGAIYAAGRTTGVFAGQTGAGGLDGFVLKYSPRGKARWIRQFGTTEADGGWGVAVDARRRVHVGGITFGEFPGETVTGGSDAFVRVYRQ